MGLAVFSICGTRFAEKQNHQTRFHSKQPGSGIAKQV